MHSAVTVPHRTHTAHLQALAYDDGVPETKNKLHRALRKTCAEAGVLPSSYYLEDDQIKKLNDVPFASGGYSDVWRGSYKGENVSIKAFRVYTTDNIRHLTKVLKFSHMRLRGPSLTPSNYVRHGARRLWFAGISPTLTSSPSLESVFPKPTRYALCPTGCRTGMCRNSSNATANSTVDHW